MRGTFRATTKEGTRATETVPPLPFFSPAARAHLLRRELCVSETNEDSQEGVIWPLVVAVDFANALQQVVPSSYGGLSLL